MNGFVFGDDSTAPKPLSVGVGESVDGFLRRNPFLAQLHLVGGDHVLELPLMTRVDALYDDGETQFHVGCSFTTNIDGNNKRVGIHSVNFELCDPAINDWRLATAHAAKLIAEFRQQNPDIVDLKDILRSGTLKDAEHFGEPWLTRSVLHKEYPLTGQKNYPLSEDEANAFFEQKAREGHREQLQWSQGIYAPMAMFLTKKVSIFFSVSKTTYWGGGDLTEAQKQTMKYQVDVAFHQRQSVSAPCKISVDWKRCIPE